MNQEKIEEGLTQFPVCEYAFINIADITFLDQVRYICKTECPQYGKSWSCPPAVGTVEECKKRCSQYTGGFIFTTIAEVNDIANMEETLATRMEHEKITRQVRDLFAEQTEAMQEKMFPCIESYGILVTDLAEKYGISFMNGANVVTWFSLLLYR